MTICAAAICTIKEPVKKKVIIAISDLMITSGDVEYETDQTKVYMFSFAPDCATNIMAMGSGDTDLCFSIASQTHQILLADGPTDVLRVAELYAHQYAQLRQRFAESNYLTPFRLSFEDLSVDSELTREATANVRDAGLGVQSLIVGIDSEPHIFHVQEPGTFYCHDGSAFYAVGSGSRQFETAFMAAGYTRNTDFIDAVLLMYSSKRRAEASPGVGPRTHMSIIDETGSRGLSRGLIGALEEHYQEIETATRTARERAIGRMLDDPGFSNLRI